MPRYFTIPEPVDAVQWNGTRDSIAGEDWLADAAIEDLVLWPPTPYDAWPANPGDWIVKHGDGIAVMSAGNFHEKYE